MVKKFVAVVEKLAKAEAKNPVVVRTVHTAWETALGALVASLSATHGDVRVAVAVAVAAGAAAVKNALLSHAPVQTPQAVDPQMPATPAVPQPMKPNPTLS